VLLGGGVTTVIFTYFFRVKSIWSQVGMTVALTGIIASVLFLIAVINHPFKGDLRVTPEGFQLVLEVFERSMGK